MTGVLVATILAVSACGGGGSSATPPPPGGTPPPVGGITRTGVAFAVGPVTGFGSVVVNGIRYDTSGAEFVVDGQVATQASLAVGDIVVIKGTMNDDNSNAVATSVEFDDNVEGPVSSVDTAKEIIIVLGQTVHTVDAIFDDNCPATLPELLNVAAVEVSGSVRLDGSIDASRIECKNVLGEMEVTGKVSSLGTDTFMINALVVDYTDIPAMLDNFPSGAISADDPVEAKGTTLGPNDELIATRVEFKGNRFDENEGDHIEIEGFITRFGDDEDFDVSDRPVTTIPGRTVYEGGTADDLGPNIKVEVEGEFDGAKTLVATKVEFKKATAVRLTAQVDERNGDDLIVLGVTINTRDGETRFEDKTGQVGDRFNISNISPMDYVEVRGQMLPPGGSAAVFAVIVERDDLDTEAILQGFVDTDGVNDPTLTVLGVTIETSGTTVYRNDDESIIADPKDFWDVVSDGSLIKAKGLESSSKLIIAEEIELQQE